MSEYWIREDGDVDYADGDVGDYNHEGIVIRDVQSQIIDKLSHLDIKNRHGYDFDSESDWDEFKNAAAIAYANELIQKNPAKKQNIEDAVHHDPEKFLMAALKQAGVTKTEWQTANGMNDARDFAMERWGWKTYRDGNVDTWRLTRKDMQAIIAGLESISDQDGWSEKKFRRYRFTINVFSNKKYFYLTIDQMEKWVKTPSANIVQDEPHDQIQPNQDQALSAVHPHYRNRPGVNPFGDSVLHSFKMFIEAINGK